jgi:hypothetical protein
MYDDGAESELTHMHLTSPSIIACRPRRLAIGQVNAACVSVLALRRNQTMPYQRVLAF